MFGLHAWPCGRLGQTTLRLMVRVSLVGATVLVFEVGKVEVKRVCFANVRRLRPTPLCLLLVRSIPALDP